MTKQPTDHFSLSDCRKTLTEHEHPTLTLTKGEYEALVWRLEVAERLLTVTEEMLSVTNRFRPEVMDWLASLEAGK